MKTTDFINKGYAESAEKYEYDDEVGMVKNNLHTIIRVLTHLNKETGEHENFPEWVQEKIAMIKQSSVEVMNYMISQHEMGDQPKVPGFDTELAESAYNRLMETTTGATGSSSIAVGPAGGIGETTTDIIRRQRAYTNQRTPGGSVKVKKVK